MTLVRFVKVEQKRIVRYWCPICEDNVPSYNKHLSHCINCNLHHTNAVTCDDAAQLEAADRHIHGGP
jgi:hypothetical protein